MYSLAIKPDLDKELAKVYRRNRRLYGIIMKKVEEIMHNPHHYKNLSYPLNLWKRVHIDKSFVLAFSVDENSKTVTLEDFEHHDKIYKTKGR